MTRSVAIIEPDTVVAARLQDTFERAGFRTGCFRDGESALSTFRTRPFSIALLDLSLGAGMCREISSVVPLVTIAERVHRDDLCIDALEAGADDCVCRTVPDRELVARVENVLRRASEDAPAHEIAGLIISTSEMRIRKGDVVHELSRGETELVAVLIEYGPRPLTSTQLAAILGASRATIESRIKSLRRKIGAERLVTQGRFGYRLLD